MRPPHKKRRVKLIMPKLQLRLTRVFLLMAAASMVVQGGYLLWRVRELADELPDASPELSAELPGFALSLVLVSVFLLLPLTVLVGVHTTFRIAGPIYRFSAYLKDLELQRGTRECRIRRGDQLQDVCALINEVTAPLRSIERPSDASVSEAQSPVTCSSATRSH